MLTFALIFAAGVAILLGMQKLDIECVNPPVQRKPAPPRAVVYPDGLLLRQ